MMQGMAGLSFLIIYIIEKWRGDKMNKEEIEIEIKRNELKKM